MTELYSKCFQPPRYGPPHSGVLEWSPEASFSKEDVPIIDTRSDISKIFENRLPHFVLDRILLSAAMLGAPNGEDFTLPIKILQTQVDDLTRAQSIDRKQKQEGPGANMLRVIPFGQF